MSPKLEVDNFSPAFHQCQQERLHQHLFHKYLPLECQEIQLQSFRSTDKLGRSTVLGRPLTQNSELLQNFQEETLYEQGEGFALFPFSR